MCKTCVGRVHISKHDTAPLIHQFVHQLTFIFLFFKALCNIIEIKGLSCKMLLWDTFSICSANMQGAVCLKTWTPLSITFHPLRTRKYIFYLGPELKPCCTIQSTLILILRMISSLQHQLFLKWKHTQPGPHVFGQWCNFHHFGFGCLPPW